MSDQSNNFESILEVATRRMLSVLGGYYIWKYLELAINLNNPIGEQKVNRNLKILNLYNAFFWQIRVSTYKSFVADLAIFFDKNGYENTFSLKKLLDSTRDKLSFSEIEKMRKEIERIKKEHGVKISFIRELRDADVAHQEIDTKARHLLYENIESLFSAVQEILNLISHKYDRSISSWNHIGEDINHQMEWIIENLERGEKARLEEIDKNLPVGNSITQIS